MFTLLLLASVAPPVPESLPPGMITRLGNTGWSVESMSFGLAFSPDGKWLAVGSRGGFDLVDPESGVVVRKVPYGHPKNTVDVRAWDAKTGHLVIRSVGNHAIYRPEQGTIHPFGASRNAVPVSPERLLAVDRRGAAFTMEQVNAPRSKKPISLEGERLFEESPLTGHPLRAEFAYSTTTSVTVRDAEIGKIRWRTWGHPLGPSRASGIPFLSISYDPTGKWLASGGSDGTVRLWHAEDGKAGPVLSMDNACCTGVSWTATGTLVAVYLDGSVELFQKGKRVSRWRSLSLKGSPSWCVSPTGDRLVSLRSGHSGFLQSWDLRTGRLLSPMDRHTGDWYRLQWLDNRRLISGDTAGVLIEWDCFAGKGRQRWELGSADHTLRADGREAAVDLPVVQRIALLDLNRNQRIGTLAYPEGTRLEAIEYAPDGKQIALIYRHATKWSVPTLRLLDTAGRQLGRDVEVGDRFASQVWPTFSQDGGEIGVRYRTGVAEPQWKWVTFARNGPKQKTIVDLGTERERFAVHPQFRYAMGVALPGVGTSDLIDLASGQVVHRWDENHWVNAASFSACGRWLALAESNELRIWELRTKRIVRRWPVTNGVTMLAFSPNGRWIAAGKEDRRIEVWDGWPSQGATRKTPPTEAELLEYWNRLASEDATAAHDAIATLLSAPHASAAFLARRMGPSLPMPRERFAQLLADLDDDFATRQRAEQTLRAAGSAVTTQVQEVLKQPGLSLERRRRLQRLQAAWPTDPAMVQRDRALFALEQMGDPGRALLYRIAEGVPEAEITQLARPALKRRR